MRKLSDNASAPQNCGSERNPKRNRESQVVLAFAHDSGSITPEAVKSSCDQALVAVRGGLNAIDELFDQFRVVGSGPGI
jgi:hypothetical protein